MTHRPSTAPSRTREWVARFRFDGLQEAYFGTVQAETEMEAELKATAAWCAILPIAPPRAFIMVPGAIRLELEE